MDLVAIELGHGILCASSIIVGNETETTGSASRGLDHYTGGQNMSILREQVIQETSGHWEEASSSDNDEMKRK